MTAVAVQDFSSVDFLEAPEIHSQDECDWSHCTLEQTVAISRQRATAFGHHYALCVEPLPSEGWQDRLFERFSSDLDYDTEQFAYDAAHFIWERKAGEKKVGFDVDVVKRSARGRWSEIMRSLAGLSDQQLDGSHQPCPKPDCGGNDRFRVFDDFEETGGMYCNHCFNSKNGDGFSSLQWLTGKSFSQVLSEVAKFLDMPPHLRNDFRFQNDKRSWDDGVDRNKEQEEWLQSRRDSDKGKNEQLIWPLDALMDEYETLKPEVIKRIVRRGEVFNIIAAPKVGKTFLSMCLAVAVSHGDPWLGFDTVQGNVLVIDNELHPETLSHRFSKVLNALQRRHQGIDVITLRGDLCDINELGSRLAGIKPGQYSLILLDALYRMLPPGTNENDNAQMTAVWNALDSYAARLDCAIGVVHHASKGEQGSKDVTDVGSGAGSISRAADTHLIIRAHERENHAVLEARCRSFASPDPVTLNFQWPVWYASTLERLFVKGSRQQKSSRSNATMKLIRRS